MRRVLAVAFLLSIPHLAPAQQGKGPVLVIMASARDYLFGAGGTIARMIDEGRPVYVLQFGNDEKDSVGLGPAETRAANNLDAERAAKVLGVREVLNLGHKSGELGYISSSEMRNQVMAMMRFYKPEIMFFPDWYTHYVEDWDIYRVGHMAEEAPYGSGSYFLQEMTYLGFPGYAAREYYFYSPYRPYRAREGGEGKADVQNVDITATLDRKLRAILELKTSNHRYAVETWDRLEKAGRSSPLLRTISEESTVELVRAYVEELAETVGKKHGVRCGEEFNHLGRPGGVPEHILEHAKPLR
jgi:LmbE family N-acetylglucosaminyl deacetylase